MRNEFILTKVDDRWDGARFKQTDKEDRNLLYPSEEEPIELGEDDRTWLLTRPLWGITFRQIHPDVEKLSSIFYIFERLNTGGEILTPMEIRKALYYGDFYKSLDELNKDSNWRDIYGVSEENDKLRDIELILRFFALQEWNSYKEPMKEFLNKFMRENQNITSEQIKCYKDLFLNTCRLICDSIGSKPFHRGGPLNTAMMDSFMVLTSKHLNNLTQEKLKRIYEKSKQDENFNQALKARVSVTETALRNRFRLLLSILEQAIK
ncbi:hypothetical protein MCHI_001215 [Candidatus Magnetoovum chiemensis]|nr:hypothetical protein MCHI_001215 [Candidatus Magnetoovum chiemensis]